MVNYSIGITTYSYRFNKFLVNLLKEIRTYSQNEIILAINGNYKEDFDENYRKNVLNLASTYNKLYPFIYPKFRSLSKLWNNIVVNSTNDYILLLNDDTTITNPIFFKTVEDNIEKLQTSFYMDGMFCYFVVKKSELIEMEWFDERFLGIGWEDTEFLERYKNVFSRELINIKNVSGIKTYIDKENVIINQRAYGKYSQFNQDVYLAKLETVKQYPHERFFLDNYDKL
jgi:hypothetical protein